MLIIYFTKLILEPAILHAYTLRRTPLKFPRCVAGQRSPITDRNIVQFTRSSLLKTLRLFFCFVFPRQSCSVRTNVCSPVYWLSSGNTRILLSSLPNSLSVDFVHVFSEPFGTLRRNVTLTRFCVRKLVKNQKYH